MYGFGANPKMQEFPNAVSHLFPCSRDAQNTRAYDMKTLFKNYERTVKNAEFLHPTYFSPLLKFANRVA
jgi:Copine